MATSAPPEIHFAAADRMLTWRLAVRADLGSHLDRSKFDCGAASVAVRFTIVARMGVTSKLGKVHNDLRSTHATY
jgi:hypothetical protein